MKKINSIGYGARIVVAGGIFLIVIPLARLAVNAVFPFSGIQVWVYISLAIGALIALSLTLLLVIELRRDKRMHAYYQKRNHKKVYLGGGTYECQSCGSRDVEVRDSSCKVCGIRFDANNVEK